MKLNIKEIREKAGYQQAEMAEKMNTSQPTYARFEQQSTRIDLERLVDFASIVNMSLIDVIGFPDKYVNVTDIAKEINKTEPEVVVQIKVTKKKREDILKTLFGENIEILNDK